MGGRQDGGETSIPVMSASTKAHQQRDEVTEMSGRTLDLGHASRGATATQTIRSSEWLVCGVSYRSERSIPKPGAVSGLFGLTCFVARGWEAVASGQVYSGHVLGQHLRADAAVADEAAGSVEHELATDPELLVGPVGTVVVENEVQERPTRRPGRASAGRAGSGRRTGNSEALFLAHCRLPCRRLPGPWIPQRRRPTKCRTTAPTRTGWISKGRNCSARQ